MLVGAFDRLEGWIKPKIVRLEYLMDAEDEKVVHRLRNKGHELHWVLQTRLRQLQRDGWKPVTQNIYTIRLAALGRQVDKRNAIIERDYPLLVTALEELSPDRNAAIILIKANVCKLLDWRLTRDGFKVLNKGISVPFPSHGQQLKFQAKFAPLLKMADL